MATYQPYSTGDFKPIGVLAGMYAGENAANQRQQNQMANLASMFDMAQTAATADTTAYNVGLQRQKEPDVMAVSNLAGETARSQNNPEFIRNMNAGLTGQSLSNAAKGKVDTALVPTAITSGIATNEASTIANRSKALLGTAETINSLVQSQGDGAARDWISRNVDVEKRQDFFDMVSNKKIGDFVKYAALQSAEHQKSVDLQNMKDRSALAVETLRGNKLIHSEAIKATVAQIGIEQNSVKNALEMAKIQQDKLKEVVAERAKSVAMLQKTLSGKVTPESIRLDTELTNAKTALATAETQVRTLSSEYSGLSTQLKEIISGYKGNTPVGGTKPAPTGGKEDVINVTLNDLMNGPTATPAASSAPVAELASPAVSVVEQSSPAYLRQQREREQQAAKAAKLKQYLPSLPTIPTGPVDQGEARAQYQQWLRSIGHIKD